jgi:hypothetical protein
MELCRCCCFSTILNASSTNSHPSFKPHQVSDTLGRRRNGRLSSLLGRALLESSVELAPASANLLTIGSRGRSGTQVCEGANSGDRVRAWREAVGMNGAVVGWRGSENRRRVLGLRVEAGGGGDTMWVTATAAVALVLSLAAFAAIGGFLLSKGMDNQIREEVSTTNAR